MANTNLHKKRIKLKNSSIIGSVQHQIMQLGTPSQWKDSGDKIKDPAQQSQKLQGKFVLIKAGNGSVVIIPNDTQKRQDARSQMSAHFIKADDGRIFAIYSWNDLGDRIVKHNILVKYHVNFLDQIEGKKVTFRDSGEKVRIADLNLPLAILDFDN